MFEISHHPFRSPSQEFHEGGRLLQQHFFAGGTVRGTQPGFEVPVEVLIGIDLRRVRREIEDFNPILALGQPCGDQLGMMHFQVIQNKKDFLAAVGDQSFHETDEQVGVHGFFNELEAHQPWLLMAEIIDKP